VSFLQTILMVLGLNMDTLAVASAVSLKQGTITRRLVFRVVFHFALFQAGLLFLGWWIGSVAGKFAGSFDHWAASILLWVIGIKMLWEARHPEPDGIRPDPSRGFSLVFLSVATSLDALAVGGTLGLLHASVTPAVVTAWVLTVVVSTTGLFIGKRVGTMVGKWAEVAGGIVLCLIGVKVLVSHLVG
jgi:manganese efflux pump family protein